MTAPARHPGTGLVLVHVITPAWGPYADIRAMYASLARRRPWTHVISPEEFRARQNTWLWNDPDTVFVLWEPIDPGPKYQRKSIVLSIYSEALDDDGDKLLPAHLDYWHAWKTMSVHFDAALTHTPYTSSVVGRIAPAFVFPVGWDEAAMGVPRAVPKFTDYTYHGSDVGRRNMIWPFLKNRLPPRAEIQNISGAYGRGLLGELDRAAASIYIAHSEVTSFSTWRLWQCASTSCVLVAEPGDTWPFTAGQEFIEIPRITPTNAQESITRLSDLARQVDLLTAIATNAHELARTYTVDRIEDDYLIPAALAVQKARA